MPRCKASGTYRGSGVVEGLQAHGAAVTHHDGVNLQDCVAVVDPQRHDDVVGFQGRGGEVDLHDLLVGVIYFHLLSHDKVVAPRGNRTQGRNIPSSDMRKDSGTQHHQHRRKVESIPASRGG